MATKHGNASPDGSLKFGKGDAPGRVGSGDRTPMKPTKTNTGSNVQTGNLRNQ